MQSTLGRPRDGVFARNEALSLSVTAHEKAVFKAIAKKRGVSVSSLLQPLLIKLADELYHQQTQKEATQND
jgi:hypothetical protein